jgi:hypothetical protein
LSDASNLTLRNENHHRGSASVHDCDDESADAGHQILSLCLWKDFLYEDWGFSLVDEENDLDETAQVEPQEFLNNGGGGAFVNEIRSGGSACLAGLKTGDKILKVCA